MRKVIFAALAVACGLVTLFFAWYSLRLVMAIVTDDGEGSLGHVGMYVAAGLLPVLTVLFGGFTVLAWRAARPRAAARPSTD